MKDIDEILADIWPKVRKRHLYPELPAPVCSDGSSMVALDIKAKQIDLSKRFIQEMSARIAPEVIIEGLLDHALSHYRYCPWNFATQLMLYREARQVLPDKDLARRAADCFMDVAAETRCVSETDTPLPLLHRHLPRGILEQAVAALYQRIWDRDLDAGGHEDIAVRLARIPYTDRSQWPASIKRFALTIQPLLEQEALMGREKPPNPLGDHDPAQYSIQEIGQGLKELAAAIDNPTEFKEIYQDFEQDLSGAFKLLGLKMGLGRGTPLEADILYYMKRAENHVLPLRKRPMQKSGSLYPDRHIPWEVGRPFLDIDPWTSFGKIAPGITQMWQRREGYIYGREEGVPDCIVIIDSSGSMPDPSQYLSPAVLGAACACEAYLRHQAQVAVYNFADAQAGDDDILPFTKDRQAIYTALCRYFGGGTCLSIEAIDMLQPRVETDIFLISDMQITNADALFQYVSDCRNRVTAVLIGINKYTEAFQSSMAGRSNVSVQTVEKISDIPAIVIGKVRDYLKNNLIAHGGLKS